MGAADCVLFFVVMSSSPVLLGDGQTEHGLHLVVGVEEHKAKADAAQSRGNGHGKNQNEML
jgi:hypothetical protein